MLDEEFCLEALKKLLKIDKDFVPHTAGSSLYIRPFVIAIDPALGVNAGKLYRFFIICSPSGSYRCDHQPAIAERSRYRPTGTPMLKPGSERVETLLTALVEIESFVGRAGWDQPARLFALVCRCGSARRWFFRSRWLRW